MFGKGPTHADLERLELKLVLAEAAGQREAARAEALAIKLGRCQGRMDSLIQEKKDLKKKLRAVSDDFTRLSEELGAKADGQGDEDPTPKTEEEARSRVPLGQQLLDEAEDQIPFADDQSRLLTRTYIERQLRMRGADAKDEILGEVLAGDTSHDDED